MSVSPQWIDPFSPAGKRRITSKVLTGSNYRLFYEADTRRTLIGTYRELTNLARKHPHNDDVWKAEIKRMAEMGTPEDRRMRQWLIGLTKKTADNLGVKVADYPSVFDDMMASIERASTPEMEQRDIALLLWCGAATLTIRGSKKSKIGKSLEKCIARSALTVIGLREETDDEDGDFRLNIQADDEVERETDAEVRTPRGYMRLEVGLIGRGNSEVISDKVGRMNRNGVILLDILPARSTAYQTAANKGVRLIQLRNNHPVEELRKHLLALHVERVQDVPIDVATVEQRVLQIPVEAFTT